MKIGILRFVFCINLITIDKNVHCTSLMEGNVTATKDVNGEMLLNLGRQLNKPVLTLLGMAIRNLENLHPCDEWTQWSDCSAVKEGYIAIKKRTRTCGGTPSASEQETKTTERDITICEGFCPQDYNITANGFCVKLYVAAKTFDDAEKQCQKDGGHVIDIDSELKHGDVKTILNGLGKHVFIDGRRKDSSSPWLLVNGLQKEFFSWSSGEPDSDSCLYIHYTDLLFCDNPCTARFSFLCEIVG